MLAVITDYEYDNIDAERSIITGAGHTLKDFQVKGGPELAAVCKDADAVVTQYSTVSREVIEAMEHCKMIIKYGIGVNNIDVAAATEKGIYVCNVPDYGVEEVSDHAVTMILCLARKLHILNRSIREGQWGFQAAYPLNRFCESVVGLLGFGRIPRLVAKKLSGFGCRILAYDPFVSEEEMKACGVEKASLEDICQRADYISVHIPLNDSTRHIIGKKELGLMKQGAALVNTSRGGLIDEDALYEALKSGKLSGAGLDVYETEPLPKEHPLLTLENVIATSHCAWYTETAITTLQRKVAEEVVNVLNGNEPFNCVNKKDLKK